MKILFLSITAGQGHHQTALALMDEMKMLGAECKMVDTFEYVNHALSETVAKTYLISTAFTPKVYGKFYSMAEVNGSMPLSDIIPSLMSKKLNNLIEDFEPDAIVCTHVFAAQVVAALRERGEISCPTIAILTDFTVHPFWEEIRNIDYYVTPSVLLEYKMHRKGLDPQKILPFGIPILPKFAQKKEKGEARNELKIAEDKFTILIMSGSMGYGNMTDTIMGLDSLEFDFQMLIVCGNNHKSYEEISNLHTKKKIYCYGYVNNVDVMMDASDCLITKPGGLTSSEALAKGIPMIMVHPIPGQEERNVEFLLNYGLAMKASEKFPPAEAVYGLLRSPDTMESLKRNMEKFARPNATRDLCEFIVEKISER